MCDESAGHACATRSLTGLFNLSISPPPLVREPAGHAGRLFAPQLFDIVDIREGIRGRRALGLSGAFADVDLVGLILGGCVLWSDLRGTACLGSSLVRRVMCRGELWSVDRWGSNALAD